MRWIDTLQCVRFAPYWQRLIFWILLYFYNKSKYPNGRFTLRDYIRYAKR